jgi:RNA polymerase sigma-70 factor (ECF subfamily)
MRTGDRAEDLQLVRACCAGCREAWNEFYRRFYGLVRTVVQRRLPFSAEDVEDTIQEVFLHLMRSLDAYDQTYPLSKFVSVVAERVATDEHRFRSREKRQGQAVPLDHEDYDGAMTLALCSQDQPVDERIANSQQVLRLRASFRKLSERCRQILRMRFEQELPYKRIGEILGASENTVTVQTRRCLDALRELYEESDEPLGGLR